MFYDELTADRFRDKRPIAGIIVTRPKTFCMIARKIVVILFLNLHLLSAKLPLCQDEFLHFF
ncbi:MAG: hypothetical protein A2X11_03985 [Bacteroidetes bacterium GWE2_42_24]|nr:MAG: hypothetical protein A2X11_03985 [Bacteroidetes bacterium GWE2_42_24]OFY26081.1 MAG: hypothetical protein A2X09_11520 [Bacteroidetes bacterium GWF2_43_11]PKP15682.1 MAG: hypothetical protein CVU06_16095 [Bacteroidetes bacterium HGW-Bacteroidetes-22]